MGVPDNQDYDILLETVKRKFCQALPAGSTRLTYSCHSSTVYLITDNRGLVGEEVNTNPALALAVGGCLVE